MRRAAWIFLAAILLPCLALAWLAIRSEQDQQVILQHQQAIIDQGAADSLAQNVRAQMDAVLADFVQTNQQLLAADGSPEALADGFDSKLREAWPLAEVGFAVDLQGRIYAPQHSDGIPAQTFRKENESFLSNREDAEVYSNAQTQLENFAPRQQTVTSTDAVQGSAGNFFAPATRHSSEMNARPRGGAAATHTATDTLLSSLSSKTESLKSISAVPSATTATATSSSVETRDLQQADAPAAPEPTSTDEGKTASSKALPSAADKTRQSASDADAASLPPMPAPTTTPKSPPPNSDESTALPTPPALDQLVTAKSTAAARPQINRVERQVAPQENTRAPDATLSNIIPAESDFRQLIGQSTSGSVARFLEDRLCLLVWSLPSPNGSIVFGAQLDQAKLVDKLRAVVQLETNPAETETGPSRHVDYCLALLDDKGHPVARSLSGFTTDWKHPFVATEIGGVLPHWEAALYLTDPGQVSHSARVLHFTIGLIILLLVVAILAGGSLIGADVGRQMRLAQQKTDFVSNVSHELKTPLTSIRMFADMLAEGRVTEPERQSTYLRIISAESARLTRLINNVLDFARLERGAPAGERHPCDLVEAARDVVETCQPHLESAAITLGFEIEAESLPLLGDRDALSQIILNLISNAEKYGGGEITVRVRRQDMPSGPMGCVDVLDRGPGIPARQVETVFAPFQRLDDSLASGVPGSGLGLTLARRMARAHGGDVTYQPRAGGGSCFTLALPLSPNKSSV